MIKLKDILSEGMSKKDIQSVIDKVYPHIIKNLGRARRGTPKVEMHSNIYARISGILGMTGEANPHAEYDWDKCKIYLYTSRMFSEEDIIRSLIHECVHANQSKAKFDAYYLCGETYDTHPYEIAARKAENSWYKYLKYLIK